jgi:uncharacterized protein YqjF (DUF2071 family)
MRNIRPRFLPAGPGISNFTELKLRTDVHDRAGVPGEQRASAPDHRSLIFVSSAPTTIHFVSDHN